MEVQEVMLSASLSLGGLGLVCSLNTEPLTALPGTAGYQLAGQGRAALTVSSQWQQLPLTAHSFPPRPGWLCLLNISSLSEPQSIVIFALWPGWIQPQLSPQLHQKYGLQSEPPSNLGHFIQVMHSVLHLTDIFRE